MSATVLGAEEWGMVQDKDGHRDYKIKWKIQTGSVYDGPALVAAAPGLAVPGATWAYANDYDPWALCWPNLTIEPYQKGEICDLWYCTQTFSTKPFSRCQDESVSNPLAEPLRLSGSFIKYTQEALYDRFGNPLVNSAFERFKGKAVEFDNNRPTVQVGMNLMFLPLANFAPMIDTVNDFPMWGLGKRMIKLSNAKWERKVYGTCSYYYSVDYEFDVNYKTFDRKLLDEATKILMLGGDADNPLHFEVYKDNNGENGKVILNGHGQIVGPGGTAGYRYIEYYEENNFMLLGIPPYL